MSNKLNEKVAEKRKSKQRSKDNKKKSIRAAKKINHMNKDEINKVLMKEPKGLVSVRAKHLKNRLKQLNEENAG